MITVDIEGKNRHDFGMQSYAPLFSQIVDSSLWKESDVVCKIFVTMLALKDWDHIYRGTAFNLAQRAHKTEQEVIESLKVLSSPDKRRIEPQPFGGRRIEKVEDGWLILNGEKYQKIMQKLNQQSKWAKQKREQRAKLAIARGKPSPIESAYIKAEADGAPQDVLDQMSAPV